MQRLSYHNLFMLLVTLLLISQPSAVQASPKKDQDALVSLKSLEIPFSQGEISLDAELDEPIWNNALIVDLNIVNSPWDNLPSPIKTTAKLIENGEFLYIAFIAEDPEPSKIQGFLTDRDLAWSHDLVGIKLDTHNNRRLNYEFFVNPYGVQNDATFNEITGLANTSWDSLWHAFGKITPQGYQVEIAIPYNILNFKDDGKTKQWAIELVRTYPRDPKLRLSHVPINRDNPCWLCQYPEAVGFEKAKIGKNLQLTPALTASKYETRNIYDAEDNTNWTSENDIEAGIDLRWGINANNLLNVTLNPDFSTVESDSGQLNVNTNFSLFYKDKRAFFLDNSDYFSSDFDLIYTRNIAAPDYGAKLTGRIDKHSYGAFITNDTQTNILLPGNLEDDIATLNKASRSGALRYRYDLNEDLTLGAITTVRSSDNYHNYVTGVDAYYRINSSNTIKGQLLNSNTLYPGSITNIVNLTDDKINDLAYKVNFNHSSEYWVIDLDHQSIRENFRADLGYMPQVDFKTDRILVKKVFYGEQDSYWQEAGISGTWKIVHNQNNELIEKELIARFDTDGPLQSSLTLDLVHGERVGLRDDISISDIDNNTRKFKENQVIISANIMPNNRTYFSVDLILGDKIDYANNRLGDLTQVGANIAVFITDHLEFDFYQSYSELKANNELGQKQNVYTEKISELRLSYQFDVQSYLKLSLIYFDTDTNPNNNGTIYSAQEKKLSTKLIYAYKLNPQTVFFLGYSDNSYQDDYLNSLQRKERTFFTKVSYAWAP